MKKVEIAHSAVFARMFVKERSRTLFFLNRFLGNDLFFFIKNNVFYYCIAPTFDYCKSVLRLIDYHSDGYELIKLNDIVD